MSASVRARPLRPSCARVDLIIYPVAPGLDIVGDHHAGAPTMSAVKAAQEAPSGSVAVFGGAPSYRMAQPRRRSYVKMQQ